MCTKKVTSWAGLKKGQKFIVKRNSNSHNYPIGVMLTMRFDGTFSTTIHNIATELCEGNTLDAKDIELLYHSVEDMKKEVEKLEREKNELLLKIKFCEENGVDEFDENEFKIFAALDILEGTSSRKEKAMLLSKILNQC